MTHLQVKEALHSDKIIFSNTGETAEQFQSISLKKKQHKKPVLDLSKTDFS